MGERLVGAEEPVAAAQEIALEHPLQRVLAQHFDDATIRGQLGSVGVLGEVCVEPEFLGHLVDRPSLFEVFSSGPNTRKFCMFCFITSRRNAPSGRRSRPPSSRACPP